jgi:hypothetical protein
MDRADYLNGVLKELYLGECLGEAVFNAYLAAEADPSRLHKWACCLQLETETKARLRPFLAKLGLDLSQPDYSGPAASLSASYLSKSWLEHMARLAAATDRYLETFRSLAEAAPPEERETVASMVEHEIALNQFAKLELSGEGYRSLDLIIAQLRWPLPAA